jgi:ABC-2 type transport system permease protein
MSSRAIAIPSRQSGVSYYARIFGKETQYEFMKLLHTRAFSTSVIGFPVTFYLLFGSSNRQSAFARYLLGNYSCMGVVSACLFGVGNGNRIEEVAGLARPEAGEPYAAACLCRCQVAALRGVLGDDCLSVAGARHHSRRSAGRGARSRKTGRRVDTIRGDGAGGSSPGPSQRGFGTIDLIYLPMSFASGFWMPVTDLPLWMQRLAQGLPTYHLAQLALNIFGFAQPGSMMRHWKILVGFAF